MPILSYWKQKAKQHLCVCPGSWDVSSTPGLSKGYRAPSTHVHSHSGRIKIKRLCSNYRMDNRTRVWPTVHLSTSRSQLDMSPDLLLLPWQRRSPQSSRNVLWSSSQFATDTSEENTIKNSKDTFLYYLWMIGLPEPLIRMEKSFVPHMSSSSSTRGSQSKWLKQLRPLSSAVPS